MFEIINIPISYIIKGANFLVPNYAVAVLLFAIAMQIILFPLGIKQQKNLVKQARLQPRIDAINKRYAGRNDQATLQKKQQETMDLYQKEGFNPMGGCLPLLIQFPILFALYNVIIDPLKYLCNLSAEAITSIGNKINELYAAAVTAGTTADIPASLLTRLESIAQDTTGKASLSAIEKIKAMKFFGEESFAELLGGAELPNFTLFGIDFSEVPQIAFGSVTAIVLFMIPVLSFVFSFASMKINRKLMPQPQNEQAANVGASMKIMDWMMPLMSLWIAFSVPAVIGLYWIYRNILGTVQQFILKKMYPTPVFTEEERKAIEKEMNGKIKKEKPDKINRAPKLDKNGNPIRSLHHIDDDDEPLPTRMPEPDGQDKPEDKKPSGVASMIAPGEMQDDD